MEFMDFFSPFQTTMPICPLCKHTYSALYKHLKNIHLVTNAEERRILLNLAAGRVNMRTSSCLISGCDYMLTRLDRHIRQAHTELTIQERASMVVEAKRRTSIKLLADLRASNPRPSMTNTLDQQEELLEEEILDEPVPLTPETDCDNEECKEAKRQYQKQLAQLTEQRDQLLLLSFCFCPHLSFCLSLCVSIFF